MPTENYCDFECYFVLVNPAPSVIVSPSSWTMDIGQSKTFTATRFWGFRYLHSYQWYVGGICSVWCRLRQRLIILLYLRVLTHYFNCYRQFKCNFGSVSCCDCYGSASPAVSIAPVGPAYHGCWSGSGVYRYCLWRFRFAVIISGT